MKLGSSQEVNFTVDNYWPGGVLFIAAACLDQLHAFVLMPLHRDFVGGFIEYHTCHLDDNEALSKVSRIPREAAAAPVVVDVREEGTV